MDRDKLFGWNLVMQENAASNACSLTPFGVKGKVRTAIDEMIG
jgi:hypothetical protein